MGEDAHTPCGRGAPRPSSPLSERESEFLAITLNLLQEHGYDRLTVDAVAASARASKATVYRRWPSKAELVLAAFTEGVRQVVVPPDTGSLRRDLLGLGTLIRAQAEVHASTISAVLSELPRNPALSEVLQQEFIQQRREVINRVFNQAVDRGEIDSAAISNDIWDVLPGYLVFRFLMPGRPPTDDTVRELVDDVIIPGLTRPLGPS
ncbi:MAG: TetR/AcrR family transcriptional regulator [Actinomycetia bacterium]|nr:TetR/AcrR family transcriptional regulator [Actinomycetes bacterium]MCH9709658.1 TetR/AcrR family transcriptional regulator [Actinomycetes bacterium]MCH9768023.1 TetR/AcrR family transcriptional regulator [Actinomycetes bacterium]